MKVIGFSTPKPRKYSYKPVFYDPAKEEAEKRLAEPGTQVPDPHAELRQKLKRSRKSVDDRIGRRSKYTSLVIMLILLLAMVYLILFR